MSPPKKPSENPARGDERILKQVRLTDESHKLVKLQAIQRDFLIMEFCDQAIVDFLKKRKEILDDSNSDRLPLSYYLPASPEGKYRSFWLLRRNYLKLEEIAEIDKLASSRILHTAIMHALKER